MYDSVGFPVATALSRRLENTPVTMTTIGSSSNVLGKIRQKKRCVILVVMGPTANDTSKIASHLAAKVAGGGFIVAVPLDGGASNAVTTMNKVATMAASNEGNGDHFYLHLGCAWCGNRQIPRKYWFRNSGVGK